MALHPIGNQVQYLRQVRSLLASIALNAPGGYPVCIRHWGHMGQTENGHLSHLLKLAEPEAVMAETYSPGLTDKLAQLAWWCEPHAAYARRMLAQPNVVQGSLGSKLAAFLVSHLPFETKPRQIRERVRLVLQPGLIDDTVKQRLWNRGLSNTSYLVGFLQAVPNQLPDQSSPRSDLEAH